MKSGITTELSSSAPDLQRKKETSSDTTDETVLRDVLKELDRERSKRAELESKLRSQLSSQSQQISICNRTTESMKTQIQQYQEIIQILTSRRKAIQHAVEQEEKHLPSLPVHVIRLLEIMPWEVDPTYLVQTITVYEWQYYVSNHRQWRSELKYFPHSFQEATQKKMEGMLSSAESPKSKETTVPAVIPKQDSSQGILGFLTNASKHSLNGVFTNDKMTERISMHLPFSKNDNGSTYEWIGGWQIDKQRIEMVPVANADTQLRTMVEHDPDGFLYGKSLQDFVLQDPGKLWNTSSTSTKSSTPSDVVRKLRRRKWTRQRVLVNYPLASEYTRRFLRLKADHARQTRTLSKLSDQLVETKTAWTNSEAIALETQSKLQSKINQLQSTVDFQSSILKAAGLDIDPSMDERGEVKDAADKKGNILNEKELLKEIGGKIGDWLHHAQKKVNEETADWTKLGQAAILEKLRKETPHDNLDKNAPGGES